MKTPVLLVIFRRPEHTRRALAAIRRARPTTLLVAADGPRTRDEAVPCAEARAVIDGVDWDCNVLTNYAATNLGCGIRVHTGIDWALSRFDDVIVLEDDCIPEPTFFYFCEELLERYRDDDRVMHISGNNFQPMQPGTDCSYYFSKYTHAWGWATWRRAWVHFDWALERWPELKLQQVIEKWCDDPYEQRYWTDIFDRMHGGVPDVWDYQWNFCCWARNGLSILPAVNLVSNIGDGPDATHTRHPSPFLNRPTWPIGPLRHPVSVARNEAADTYTFASNFGGDAMKAADSPRARLRARLGPLLGPLRAAKRLARIVDRRKPSTQA